MGKRSSRHRGLDTYRMGENGSSRDIELYVPRVARNAPTESVHRVEAGDRLDLLAYRYYGDPLLYWRIVDANPTMDPESLLEPGVQLTIPEGGD